MTDYSDHHKRMRREKAPRPDWCQSCGAGGKVWLSLIGEATHALQNSRWRNPRQPGGALVTYETPVSEDPAAYAWECPKCNQARRGGRFATGVESL